MNSRSIRVIPSILSADFRILETEVRRAEDGGGDLIHCDVMDGQYVPNITFGPFVVEAVKKVATVPLDVHLMIANPLKYITAFRDAGADTIIVHAEIDEGLEELIPAIRHSGALVGVTVNPDKPVDLFLNRLSEIDQVLIMTVHAGFGGQDFIGETVPKIRAVYDAAHASGLNIDIEVDGGINGQTAEVCARNGANMFVAGAYIFSGDDYAERISSVRAGAHKGAAELK